MLISDAIKANTRILRTVFRNIVECDNCGEQYAVEFSLKRYLERHDMNTHCLYCGNIQTITLQLHYDDKEAPMKYSDHSEFERGVC